MKIKDYINIYRLWKIFKQLNNKQTMEKLKLYLSKNWKTTVAGVLILIVLPTLVSAGILTADQEHTATLVLTGAGFIVSKDGDKSGL